MSAEGFRARARPEPPSAQILVVVANTLERSWRTDAEKGFLSTAVAQVLVDPKPRAKALQRGPHDGGERLRLGRAERARAVGADKKRPRCHPSGLAPGPAASSPLRGGGAVRRGGSAPERTRRGTARPPRATSAAELALTTPTIANGPTWRKGTRSRFRDPASRKRSPARSVRLVGAIRQPARRSRRRTRGELSFLLKRPSIPGTRMARR